MQINIYVFPDIFNLKGLTHNNYAFWCSQMAMVALYIRGTPLRYISSLRHIRAILVGRLIMMTSSNGNISALLAICAGNSPLSGEFPAQRPVTRGSDVYFDLHLNKWLSKQWWGWWFETLSHPLWRHCSDRPTTAQRFGFCISSRILESNRFLFENESYQISIFPSTFLRQFSLRGNVLHTVHDLYDVNQMYHNVMFL